MMLYTTKPRTYWNSDLEEDVPAPSPITVYDQGESVEPVGLVDSTGQDICRVKDRIGFI